MKFFRFDMKKEMKILESITPEQWKELARRADYEIQKCATGDY